MLASGGIHVSNGKQYALSDVIDAIKCAFGASPQIVCKKGSVEELRLCFDKDLKVSSPFVFRTAPYSFCLLNIFLQFVSLFMKNYAVF